MSNPLFEALSSAQNGMNVNPIVQSILEFKNQFSGNPQEKVQELLNTGKMSQEQCNALVQQAQSILSQFGSFLK